MFYTYLLESLSKPNEFYRGYTDNLSKRLDEHNRGKNFSTKRYRPWKLVYSEACLNKKDAQRREQFLKTSQGRRLIKARIKEYLYSRKNRVSTPGYAERD